jgi:hypothetical protein
MAIWERPVDVGIPRISRASVIVDLGWFALYLGLFVVAVNRRWAFWVECCLASFVVGILFNFAYVAFRRAQARGWI